MFFGMSTYIEMYLRVVKLIYRGVLALEIKHVHKYETFCIEEIKKKNE